MRKFTEYIGEQFGNPHGFVGKVCCVIMNIINKAMYKKTVSLLKISDNDNVVYTKEWLDKLSYTEKGFKKYEPGQLIEFGKQAGFADIEVMEILKGKSFVVIYTK